MEEILKIIKKELNLESLVCSTGESISSCITDFDARTLISDGRKIFSKAITGETAREIFEGEYNSLVALEGVDIVRVPHPFKVIDHPKSGAIFVMEHLDMTSLSHYQAELGEQIARLHKCNHDKKSTLDNSSLHKKNLNDKYISQFGFDVPTFCGRIMQENTWTNSWTEFFAKKLEFQTQLLEKSFSDREVTELWSQLSPQLSSIINENEVMPSLLHGDLWAGNVGETDQGPVVFDPSSFYGHSEYDLAITKMFGGFTKEFYSSYHKIIPKTPGFDTRNLLYQLFHHLNHWNHFGSTYRESSISIFKRLLKTL